MLKSTQSKGGAKSTQDSEKEQAVWLKLTHVNNYIKNNWTKHSNLKVSHWIKMKPKYMLFKTGTL